MQQQINTPATKATETPADKIECAEECADALQAASSFLDNAILSIQFLQDSIVERPNVRTWDSMKFDTLLTEVHAFLELIKNAAFDSMEATSDAADKCRAAFNIAPPARD